MGGIMKHRVMTVIDRGDRDGLARLLDEGWVIINSVGISPCPTQLGYIEYVLRKES